MSSAIKQPFCIGPNMMIALEWGKIASCTIISSIRFAYQFHNGPSNDLFSELIVPNASRHVKWNLISILLPGLYLQQSWKWSNIIELGHLHFNDVITGRWRLKSPASRLFTQPYLRAQIKENIKTLRHCPLCGEFTGDRWIPRTNGQ